LPVLFNKSALQPKGKKQKSMRFVKQNVRNVKQNMRNVKQNMRNVKQKAFNVFKNVKQNALKV